ncbi:lipocalin family protein [Thalassotalea litorea]|uniref:lipocalin family protein n=1 Tax=Thalassotalea litorea TaxID=2020715 RepID=UPI003735A166
MSFTHNLLLSLKAILPLALVLNITSCTSIPEGVQPVEDFELSRYLGTWYEVARLDHSFERGLDQVTAEYTVDEDGNVVVLNKGFDTEDKQWSTAKGKAKFVNGSTIGHLKVSFFGPFYSSYVISHLQEAGNGKGMYQTAYVVGYDTDYVWLLSRTPTIDDREKQQFIEHVAKFGVNTDELIWVNQQPR